MDINILKNLIDQNKSTYEIAAELNSSQTNIRYWLKKYGLKTKIGIHGQRDFYLCKFCGDIKKENFCNKGKGRLSYSKCKACHNKATINRCRETKLRAIKYKGGKCIRCGYDKCPQSMHFHHLDKMKKDPNWKKMRTWKFEKIIKELDKCILVCANCHGEIHHLDI